MSTKTFINTFWVFIEIGVRYLRIDMQLLCSEIIASNSCPNPDFCQSVYDYLYYKWSQCNIMNDSLIRLTMNDNKPAADRIDYFLPLSLQFHSPFFYYYLVCAKRDIRMLSNLFFCSIIFFARSEILNSGESCRSSCNTMDKDVR